MLLSKACIYGLRASLYLAMQPQERPYLPIREISEKLDISFHFLTKIFQQITSAGLMASFKGPNGGVHLVKTPEQTTIMDIVVAVDGDALFTQCVLGLPGCGHDRPCPMHDKWAYNREALRIMFETTTLQELANKTMKMNLRLSDNEVLNTLLRI